MNSKVSAKRNIFWGIINRIIIMLLPFLNRTVLINVLGSEYLGLDSLFASILQMLNIAELGFSSAIVFSMYEPVAKGNNEKICALLKVYKTVYRVIGLIVLVIGVLIIPLIPKLIKGSIPQDINIFVLYFIFLLNTVLGYWLFAYKKSLLSANQREDLISNINSSIVIIKTILQILFLIILKKYYIYILFMPLMTVVENLVVCKITKKIFPHLIPKGEIDKDTKNGLKKRVSGLMIQKVCAVSRNSLDSIVISAYIGLNWVAIYGNYYYILAALHSLLGSITNAIAGIIGIKIVKKTPEKNYHDMMNINFVYMWIASLTSVCLLVLYQPFMTIWMGKDRLLPTNIVVLLSCYYYSLCIGDVRYLYTTGAGLWWEGRFRSMLEAASNLVLNIILGKFFGIKGVVIATLISIIFINFGYGATIVFKFYFKNDGLIKYYMKNIHYFITTLIAGLICYETCKRISISSKFITIFLYGVICFVETNIVLLISYMKTNEFVMIREKIMNKLKGKII